MIGIQLTNPVFYESLKKFGRFDTVGIEHGELSFMKLTVWLAFNFSEEKKTTLCKKSFLLVTPELWQI